MCFSCLEILWGGGGGGGVNRIRKALIYFRELRKLGSGCQLLERGWERVK